MSFAASLDFEEPPKLTNLMTGYSIKPIGCQLAGAPDQPTGLSGDEFQS